MEQIPKKLDLDGDKRVRQLAHICQATQDLINMICEDYHNIGIKPCI